MAPPFFSGAWSILLAFNSEPASGGPLGDPSTAARQIWASAAGFGSPTTVGSCACWVLRLAAEVWLGSAAVVRAAFGFGPAARPGGIRDGVAALPPPPPGSGVAVRICGFVAMQRKVGARSAGYGCGCRGGGPGFGGGGFGQGAVRAWTWRTGGSCGQLESDDVPRCSTRFGGRQFVADRFGQLVDELHREKSYLRPLPDAAATTPAGAALFLGSIDAVCCLSPLPAALALEGNR